MAKPHSPALSPRAGRTRAALLAAGMELLVDRPVDGIAIDEIVARAGVAKGSFFNHFEGKRDFAAAIGAELRCEVEALVAKANAGIDDPIARLVGGMEVAAYYALHQPRRSAVLLRSFGGPTSRDHPLNQGLSEDINAACKEGLLPAEAAKAGVLYWLGLCHALMVNMIEEQQEAPANLCLLQHMAHFGLRGLGLSDSAASAYAAGITG